MTLRSPIRNLFQKMSLGHNPSTRLLPLGHIVSVYGKNVNILCELIPSLKERFTQGELTDHKSSPNVDVIPNIKPLMKTVYKFSKNKDDELKL